MAHLLVASLFAWDASLQGPPHSLVRYHNGSAGVKRRFVPKPLGPAFGNVTLVHVGESAGTSVARYLQDHDVAFYEVHVQRVPLAFISGMKVIVTLRDPIERFVSAFYDHGLGGSSNSSHPFSKLAIGSCFPNSVDELALALANTCMGRHGLGVLARAHGVIIPPWTPASRRVTPWWKLQAGSHIDARAGSRKRSRLAAQGQRTCHSPVRIQGAAHTSRNVVDSERSRREEAK